MFDIVLRDIEAYETAQYILFDDSRKDQICEDIASILFDAMAHRTILSDAPYYISNIHLSLLFSRKQYTRSLLFWDRWLMRHLSFYVATVVSWYGLLDCLLCLW